MSFSPPYGQTYHVRSVTQVDGETVVLQRDHLLQTLHVGPSFEPTTLTPGNARRKIDNGVIRDHSIKQLNKSRVSILLFYQIIL